MINVDIIILANTINDSIHQMNMNCINSILQSEDSNEYAFNIILVESNALSDYIYPQTLIVKPVEKFGYNKFMMIGLQYSIKGDYIAFCNNDLLFSANWISSIHEFSQKNITYHSFSPIDSTWPGMKKIDTSKMYHEGYYINTFISGWCLVLKSGVIESYPQLLDPYFDFYCADDNFSYVLRKYNLKNALITGANVKHLGAQSTDVSEVRNYLLELDKMKIKYPFYFRSNNYRATVSNMGYLMGHLKMYDKWGGIYSLAMKDKFFKWFPFLKIQIITKIVYSIKFPF